MILIINMVGGKTPWHWKIIIIILEQDKLVLQVYTCRWVIGEFLTEEGSDLDAAELSARRQTASSSGFSIFIIWKRKNQQWDHHTTTIFVFSSLVWNQLLSQVKVWGVFVFVENVRSKFQMAFVCECWCFFLLTYSHRFFSKISWELILNWKMIKDFWVNLGFQPDIYEWRFKNWLSES